MNRIRAEEDTPVLFVTASPEVVFKLLPKATVISKPFTLGELATALSRAIAAFHGNVMPLVRPA